MLNQIFSKVIFSLGFDGRLSDFLDPEYPRPWEAEAVLYGKLVRRQPELCDAIIWKKNKNAKKKKNQNNRDKQTKLSVPMPWLLKLRWRLSEKISAASKGWEKPWAKPSIWMHCGVLANQTFFLKKVVGNITNNLKSWSQNLATPNTFKLLKLPHLAKREYVTDFQTKYVVELTAQRLTLTCCLRNRTRW